jgi:lipid-binding SYLF domain-containing protein
MDFKSLISQLDQLNEATEKTKTGLKHTAEPGGYGRKDDEDEEGNKIKDKTAEKKGKGRPKKATSTSGEDKKYDFSAFGVTKGKDVKLPKYDKKKTKKHSIKEYLDQMYAPLNEMGITVKPMPGASQIIGADGKPMGTADAATANTIKQASEKGTLKLGGDEEMKEGDIGKHNNATTGFDAMVKKLTPKYGVEAAKRIAGAQLKKIREADQPPRDALASPLTLEAKKPDANKNGIPDYAEDGKGKNDLKKKKVKEDMDSESNTDKKKCPPMSHIKKMCQDGKSVAEICKMHPDCDQKELKQMVADCKKKMVKEGMDQKLNAARSEGKAHGLRGHSHCGKNYEDMEEARCYHEGYKEGLDECYGQMPIQGYVGETTPVVNTMASYGAEEGELAEADIEESPFTWAAKNTPKGDKFSLGGKEFVKNDAFAFEALDKQLNALLEDKEVTEGMTVSISKGQQGSPDSVSVSAQDGEADQLLSVIKSAGLGLFGGDDSSGMSHADPMTVDNGGEPAEIGAGGDAIEVVGDHDGMMSLMKKLSGIGGGEQSHDEHSHDEETCESCAGMMEAGHSCSKDTEMVDEVESEDQMTYQMAEDNPPDSGAAEVDAEDASVSAANAAAAAYNPSQDIDEGGDGGEASDAGNVGVEAGDADEEMKASMNEAETDDGELTKEPGMSADQKQKDGLDLEESSSFFNLYKKLAMLSEESTSEKDDKAEKAAKKVAKDIEYDEDHKGKDDDKAEEAGKKVKKDIEYDDKKDKKEKKLDEWANDAGPGKSASDTAFETDIDFMMNVISGGLNKRKQTGQTTIPVIASQLGRQVSRNTTGINESIDSSDAVAQWKKLAGLK